MSRDIPLNSGGSLEAIFQLQDQVKGLMETVNQLHKAYHLDSLNIPKPDQYVRARSYRMGDVYDRMPITDPELKAAPKSKAPEPEAQPLSLASETSSLTPYKYTSLSADSSEIRLLALATSKSVTDPISCRLVTASLDNIPENDSSFAPNPIKLFTPLSYCWGTISMSKSIIVDGQSFLVTPSLCGALLHFRNRIQDPPVRFGGKNINETYWWIDAICINQNDIDERNNQVGLMTRLYRQAKMVHVWLGEESDDSARAMKLIRELAYLPTSDEEWTSWDYISKPGQTHRPDGPGQPMVALPTEPAAISAEERSKNYNALISLYQRPWFSRVWIRQEVALPGSVTFHCGTNTCSWEETMRTADILTYLLDECHLPALKQEGIRSNGSFASCFKKAGELNTMRDEIHRGIIDYTKLQKLVLESRDCQATDPRDKIFAMLPLTNPDETDVTADYRKDSREVYKDLALSLITTRMDYLSGCENSSRSNGLPSWVPNLETPWNSPLAPLEIGHQKSLYNDWGNPPPDLPQFTYVPEASRLDVQGVIFDEIRTINHDSFMSADSSNAEVRVVTALWRGFYSTQRDELFDSWMEEDESSYWDKHTQCMSMFDQVLDDEGWEFRVLQNTEGDEERRVASRDVTRFSRMEDDAVDHDPTLKIVRRLLPSDSIPYSERVGKEYEYFAVLRPLAVGRRVAITSKGAMVLVPVDAEPGDEVCFFDGSTCPFVIRTTGDDTWAIVGQAYYFGWVVLYQANPKLMKTTIRLV